MDYTTNYELKKPGREDIALIDDLNEDMDTLDSELKAIDTEKAPNDHASYNATYGLGSSSKFGHLKIRDTLNVGPFNANDPEALSAYQGRILNEGKLDKSGYAASRIVVTDGNGTIIAYIDGPTVSQLYAMRDFDDSSTLKTQLDAKAPTDHASTGTTYGVGNQSYYGHVKVIDVLTRAAYAAGEALSAYQGKVLNDSKAPNNHQSTSNAYGVGTSEAYGHLKIANNLSTSSFDPDAPVALSAYQGKLLYDGKAPMSHKSADGTYGLGSGTEYGHVKVINGLLSAAYAAGEALSAFQGAVLKGMIDALTSCASISSGANLNNYKTTGHYYVSNATTAAGVTNSPTTASGYSLHVFPHGASGCYQQAEDNSGNVYSRVLPASNGSWTAWKTLG